MSKKITIIDYGMGNLYSVQNALRSIGAEPVVTSDAAVIAQAEKILLPGVGAFGDCMANLEKSGLIPVIMDSLHSGKPFLGICLGMLHTELKIPHMGWNKLELRSPSPLLEGAEGEYVYFVHSFHAEPEDRSIITSVCDYGMEVTASVGRGKVQAFQFHPEKSSRVGMRLLKNFVEL